METLVATVLLIVIFTVSSLTVNHLFGNSMLYDTRAAVTQLHELEYRYRSGQLSLPYTETFNDWNIAVSSAVQHNTVCVTLNATHAQTQKIITQTIVAHAENP